ncbi:DUF4865 family protein [Kitasatospora sp. NPDC006697]|uniref:DUF4865 family protein n=1 Tax=Kitasatospora sp. NPDC006697 TaxID=3364020 RepID=UPI003687CA08
MQAMQYEITLPADYDMGIIHRRVAERGHLLDAFPGLGLKAYLVRERGQDGSPVNQYAPFYLWNTTAGRNAFLAGPGFRGLCADFGRPEVRSWPGLAFHRGPESGSTPRAAVRRLTPVRPGTDPGAQLDEAVAEAAALSGTAGLHSIALGLDAARWELVLFALGTPELDLPGDRYRVHHLSEPELDRLPEGRH